MQLYHRHNMLVALLLLNGGSLFARSPARSDLPAKAPELIWSAKYPNSALEGDKAVFTPAIQPSATPGGFTELLPFIVSSPNQEEAGSCLYMSLTGIAEWWLARLNPALSRDMNGPIDLSERFLMHQAGVEEGTNGVKDWRTDSIYLYNQLGHGLTNASYPFAKGWTKEDSNGDSVVAEENEKGATYGTQINWLRGPGLQRATKVTLPAFRRDVIFADPEHNQWNIGVTPDDIVKKVKDALQKQHAPVHVVYNHYGYWHAVDIMGFDDGAETGECQFVNKMPDYFAKEAASLQSKAEQTEAGQERDKLLARAARFQKMGSKVENTMSKIGGCAGHGAFYVRDSLYDNPNGPKYDYDPSRSDDERPWGKPYVMREYEWLRVVVNHVTQITVDSTDSLQP